MFFKSKKRKEEERQKLEEEAKQLYMEKKQKFLSNELVNRVIEKFCTKFLEEATSYRDPKEERYTLRFRYRVNPYGITFERISSYTGAVKEEVNYPFSIYRYPDLSPEDAKLLAKIIAEESVNRLKKIVEENPIKNDSNVHIYNHWIDDSVQGVVYTANNGAYEAFKEW